MALYNFHRVLIFASILFFFGLALFALRQYSALGGATNMVMGVGSAAVTVGMIAYLIRFNLRLLRASRATAP